MSNAKTDGKNRSKTAGAAALLVGTLGGLWALGGALGLGGFLGLGGVAGVTTAGSGCETAQGGRLPPDPPPPPPPPPPAEILWRHDYDVDEYTGTPIGVAGDMTVTSSGPSPCTWAATGTASSSRATADSTS